MKVDNSYRQDLKIRIVATATSMFHKHGIKSVKMDDIANALSISKRTLYEIYDNKEDLLYEVVQSYEIANHKRIIELDRPDANVMDILVGFLRLQLSELGRITPIFFEDLHKYPNVLKLLHKMHENRQKKSVYFFKRGVEEGYFIENVNFDIVRTLGDVATSGTMSSFLYRKYDIKELFHTFVFVFIRGICTMKGIKILDEFNKDIDSFK